MSRKVYSLKDHLAESLKDPAFKKAWEESEIKYQLSRQAASQRLRQKPSSRGWKE